MTETPTEITRYSVDDLGTYRIEVIHHPSEGEISTITFAGSFGDHLSELISDYLSTYYNNQESN